MGEKITLKHDSGIEIPVHNVISEGNAFVKVEIVPHTTENAFFYRDGWKLIKPKPTEPVADWTVIQFWYIDFPLVAIRINELWSIAGDRIALSWCEMLGKYKIAEFDILRNGKESK